MCGIFGTVNYRISEDSFRSGLDLLKHRGPDGYGIWSSEDQSVRIGHRRLAIIDISDNGKQPMEAEERYIISYNGEIYNYIELRSALENQGIRFTTQSDTEVLLKLFIHNGVNALHQLNGMWSFVIYDKVEKTLFMSRDRLGEKPLYYIHQGINLHLHLR
jgi:asparagine synthase (glutamine-hydrolysing)